jgi:hypothetical protein
MVHRLQPLSRCQADLPHARPLSGAAEVWAGADPEHADARRVAFEKRVHRLRGRVGHELDRTELPRANLSCDPLDRLAHAVRDADCRSVRGRDDRVSEHGVALGVAGDRLRERTADVDSDPDRHA